MLINMYKFVGKPGKMYEFGITKPEIKMNAEESKPYYGECDTKLFSENIRRLMHTGKYTWQQAIAITFSQCNKEGKAHVEGEKK
jgi:hypothetical protein